MVDRARRGSDFVVIEIVVGEEGKNSRREAGALRRLKRSLALQRQGMPVRSR